MAASDFTTSAAADSSFAAASSTTGDGNTGGNIADSSFAAASTTGSTTASNVDASAVTADSNLTGNNPHSTSYLPASSAEPNQPMLEFDNVRAAYGSIEVIHGVTLGVAEGSVFALLGPNGAGKSTMLKICAGLLPLTGGEVRMAGVSVHRPDQLAITDDLARRGVCLIPEGKGIFPNLSVKDNLQMMTNTGKTLAQIEAAAYSQFPRLGERRRQLAGTLSGGEQQMLAMSRALTTDPALLLLDELSMGLAPIIVEDLYQVVGEVAKLGVTILVVEQFARTVLGVADRAAIMISGQISKVGDPAELEHELEAAYLGGNL